MKYLIIIRIMLCLIFTCAITIFCGIIFCGWLLGAKWFIEVLFLQILFNLESTSIGEFATLVKFISVMTYFGLTALGIWLFTIFYNKEKLWQKLLKK